MTTLFRAWIEFARAHPRLQQFGQRDDESTFGGATGCTHTNAQRLVLAKTGRLYSHDELSSIATYPWPAQNRAMRGMYSGGSDDEFGRIVDRFQLPYRLAIGMSYRTWRPWLPGATNERGPVMIGVLYGWWPEEEGYRYGNVRADGRPNGYASRGGKTQLAGAESIYHAVLAIGARKRPNRPGYWGYANEPNHGSQVRPEHPPYDRMMTSQLRKAYEHYGYRGRGLLAWVPTERFRPKGF